MLKHFPDYTHLETVETARAKSSVLPVGCDLRRLDWYQGQGTRFLVPSPAIPSPLILWNQRWEYDKDPETMLRALYALADEGLDFRVALAGENFRMQPAEFEEARARLGDRLVHYGYAESEADYARLLWDADIVLSTAIHEFFGVSIVEAITCGCLPILPRRLSYPELIPAQWHDRCLYDDFDGLLAHLRATIADPTAPPALRASMARFDWQALAAVYDTLLAEVGSGGEGENGRKGERRNEERERRGGGPVTDSPIHPLSHSLIRHSLIRPSSSVLRPSPAPPPAPPACRARLETPRTPPTAPRAANPPSRPGPICGRKRQRPLRA